MSDFWFVCRLNINDNDKNALTRNESTSLPVPVPRTNQLIKSSLCIHFWLDWNFCMFKFLPWNVIRCTLYATIVRLRWHYSVCWASRFVFCVFSFVNPKSGKKNWNSSEIQMHNSNSSFQLPASSSIYPSLYLFLLLSPFSCCVCKWTDKRKTPKNEIFMQCKL